MQVAVASNALVLQRFQISDADVRQENKMTEPPPVCVHLLGSLVGFCFAHVAYLRVYDVEVALEHSIVITPGGRREVCWPHVRHGKANSKISALAARFFPRYKVKTSLCWSFRHKL